MNIKTAYEQPRTCACIANFKIRWVFRTKQTDVSRNARCDDRHTRRYCLTHDVCAAFHARADYEHVARREDALRSRVRHFTKVAIACIRRLDTAGSESEAWVQSCAGLRYRYRKIQRDISERHRGT